MLLLQALDLPELPDDLVGQQAELRRENKEVIHFPLVFLFNCCNISQCE